MIHLLAGLGLGLSLIVAIGAQNVFVLRQGIRREHVLAVILVCAASDAVLILAGVGGLGIVIDAVPWVVDAARWLGAAFLLGYGTLAARRAWRGPAETLHVEATAGPERAGGIAATKEAAADAGHELAAIDDVPTGTTLLPRREGGLVPVLLTVLALTWLNPHVYLDTVLLLGSVAATHGPGRWLFACGAVAASALWFTALGFGARVLGRWLDTPAAWRILDAVIAIVMATLAVSLVVPVIAG